MCCFSGPITHVSGTSNLARLEGERQSLAYQMRLASGEDVAMILPLPIAPGHDDSALEFVNLAEAPEFFPRLSQCFRPPPSRAPDCWSLPRVRRRRSRSTGWVRTTRRTSPRSLTSRGWIRASGARRRARADAGIR